MKQELWQRYLDEFIAILTKNKLHYWLDGGVLLGAIREGNFIGKDTDIDLGIYEFELNRQNYDQLKEDLDDANWIQKRAEAHQMNTFKKDGLQIEIWRFDHYENPNYYYHKGWDGIFLFPAECLNTLDKINFLGTEYSIPNNPILYLETLYGKNWKIPTEMKKPYDYPNYYPNDLKKQRPIFDHKKFFFELLDILEENKIPYYLFCGTLLGAIREKNFLKEDINDTDIAVNDRYYWIIRKLFDKLITEKNEYRYKYIWRKEISIEKIGSSFKLDIFFMKQMENKYYIYSYEANPINKVWNQEWRARFDYDLFYPLQQIDFLGRKVNVPKEIQKILQAHYGNWQLPPSFNWVTGCKQDVDKAYSKYFPAGISGKDYQIDNKSYNIGFMCVNFLRKDSTKLCIESLKKNAPNVKIYVADQDFPTGEMIQFYETNNIEYYFVPHDIGLSWCRNFLIDKIKEPYLMWGDNDFIFESNHNMNQAITLLENKIDIGFVGGSVYVNNKMMHYERLLSYLDKYGILIYTPLELTNPPKQTYQGIDYYYCDMTFNYVIARTKYLQDNDKLRWNPNIKVRFEHSCFFIHLLLYQNLKVVYCPSMQVIHVHDIKNENYNKFRGRKNDGKAFADEFNLIMNFTVGAGREMYSTGEVLTVAQLQQLKQNLTEQNWWTK